jgi:hypothetical protein
LELSIGLNECPNAFGAGTIFAGRIENIGIELFSAEAFQQLLTDGREPCGELQNRSKWP